MAGTQRETEQGVVDATELAERIDRMRGRFDEFRGRL
jgi:hypothetical protein